VASITHLLSRRLNSTGYSQVSFRLHSPEDFRLMAHSGGI
jgi:hypothetical protein